jgi:hypothetical protein
MKQAKELKLIAKKFFSISPNLVSCERGFSQLGWMCGKYRINLDRKRLESMAKMHTYYMLNAKNELSYYRHELTSEEISNIIRNGGLFNKGEDDNIDEINESDDN